MILWTDDLVLRDPEDFKNGYDFIKVLHCILLHNYTLFSYFLLAPLCSCPAAILEHGGVLPDRFNAHSIHECCWHVLQSLVQHEKTGTLYLLLPSPVLTAMTAHRFLHQSWSVGGHMKEINAKLESLRPPHMISRQFRGWKTDATSLDGKWKGDPYTCTYTCHILTTLTQTHTTNTTSAAEYKNFVFYAFEHVMQGMWDTNKFYDHFMLLVHALRILGERSIMPAEIDAAEKHLEVSCCVCMCVSCLCI